MVLSISPTIRHQTSSTSESEPARLAWPQIVDSLHSIVVAIVTIEGVQIEISKLRSSAKRCKVIVVAGVG